jgi:uncharacterized coiled-coil protein SlyX
METINNEEVLKGLELVKAEAKKNIQDLKDEIMVHRQILYRSEKAIVNLKNKMKKEIQMNGASPMSINQGTNAG